MAVLETEADIGKVKSHVKLTASELSWMPEEGAKKGCDAGSKW